MAASSTSEGGRALRWVARAGAYGVSRGSLSGSFTLSEPTKEAHDSEVRPSSADAGGVPGAASPHQCPAPRATTRPSPRSLQSTQNSGSFAMTLLRFSITFTSEGRWRLLIYYFEKFPHRATISRADFGCGRSGRAVKPVRKRPISALFRHCEFQHGLRP